MLRYFPQETLWSMHLAAKEKCELSRGGKKILLKILKIDRSFIMDMDTNDNNRKIVKSIIDLGHNLDLQVVAEGVENQESLDMLRRLDCDMAQGYHILKPKPFEELTDWLQKETDLQQL